MKAHSSVERACLLGAVRCHKVPSDDRHCMCGAALMSAIERDRRDGLIPFFVCINYYDIHFERISNK